MTPGVGEHEKMMSEAVRQAAMIADTAIWAAMASALRAAEACGCHDCRARANRTLHWADRMLAPSEEDDEAARREVVRSRR